MDPLTWSFERKVQRFAGNSYYRGSLTDHLSRIQERYRGDVPADTADILQRTIETVKEAEDLFHLSLQPDQRGKHPLLLTVDVIWDDWYVESVKELMVHIKAPDMAGRAEFPRLESLVSDLLCVLEYLLGRLPYDWWCERYVYQPHLPDAETINKLAALWGV